MPLETPTPPAPTPAPSVDTTIPLKDLRPKSFKTASLDELWILYYRHHMSVNNMKIFQFKGSLQEARVRADRHCKIMGYRMTFIRPLVVDIDYEERWKFERGEEPLG